MRNGNIREKKKKRTETIFEGIMTENFPRINIRHKTQVQEAQKTPNRINSPPKRKPYPTISFSSYIKSEIKKNSLKKPEEINSLPIKGKR